ncbi:unnamed protein product [Pleuronectes platessa]|uniref:Uncharacterized protein n=1 Tax=Pleuronectes platessa TaxID=8262 RepID=A0A9N7YRR9_PLEPL|nr:unnamed protein product [Pleuronectes platessa]
MSTETNFMWSCDVSSLHTKSPLSFTDDDVLTNKNHNCSFPGLPHPPTLNLSHTNNGIPNKSDFRLDISQSPTDGHRGELKYPMMLLKGFFQPEVKPHSRDIAISGSLAPSRHVADWRGTNHLMCETEDW